jgi:hypothetical protein
MRKLLFFCVLIGLNQSMVIGQDKPQKEVSYSLSGQMLHAWFYAHSEAISQYKGVIGSGIQIDFNRYRKDELAYQYAHRHYNSGFGFQYVKFSNEDLGEAANLYYFLEPFLIEGKKASLRLRAAGGLNYGSNPYNKETNPENDAYSSTINGYLGLGMSLNFALGNKLQMMLNATYSHFSNGNTKNPNTGVNYPNIGVGLEYKLATKNVPLGKMLFYKEHWRYDVGFLFSNKSLPTQRDRRFWAYGLNMQVSYQVHPIHAFTVGVEGIIDKSMRSALDSSVYTYNLDLDHRLAGIMLGHEFLFNRMIFSQQLGYYVYKEIPDNVLRNLYHRWGINYKLNRRVMLGINLNANLQKAFIFDGRLIFSLYK